ncbi:MAG TPA: sialate O-acetylesterase [Verrucomicrobiae bacterium]|jgi:sialate O-acetylesterase
MHPKHFFSALAGSALLILLTGTLPASADVKLPGLFSDHMVLQMGAPIRIWGWADPGEQVTVVCGGNSGKVTADANGKWMLRLPPVKSTEPFAIKVQGKNAVTIEDVVMGEVWVASGQSNMEFGLGGAFEAEKHIEAADNAKIRLFTVPKLRSDKPVDDIKAHWEVCSPDSARRFSAVAYFFARDLQKARQVPVGVIHTSWGGSPAEVWMSEKVLSSNPDYKRDILDAYPAQLDKFKKAVAQWEKESAAAKAEGKEFKKNKPWASWKPCELYNGMIAPLIPFSIKGAIWYQGESNAGRAWEYRSLMADLIRNWRHDWNQGKFEFFQVQLAPFMAIKDQPSESSWAELREAQNIAAKSVGNAGVAVITDVGEEKDIHPKKKEPVGARLALAARGIAYHEKIEYSGPIYKKLKIKGDKAILSFDHIGSGLTAKDGALKGFAICGEDKKWVWGKAEIDGDNVVVSSSSISKPVAVRYGCADFPVVNLWNKDGLPASPFRTDDFEMITKPKPKTIARN